MKKSLLPLLFVCGLCFLNACGSGSLATTTPLAPATATHFSVSAPATVTTPAVASALNWSSPARVSPRGGATGTGDAKAPGHGAPQKGQLASVRRMWRAQEGQARSRASIRAVCAER